MIVQGIVRQHVEEAAALHARRSLLCHSRRTTLDVLARVDERLNAHVDGIAIAGAAVASFCAEALQTSAPGEAAFPAAIAAILTRDHNALESLFQMAVDDPAVRSALISAFGWVEREHLQGLMIGFLRRIIH